VQRPPSNTLTTDRADVLRAAGPPRSRNRRWRWLAVGLIGATASWGLTVAYRRSQAPKPTTFVTVPLARGNLTETVTAVGTLAPVDAVELGAEVTGRLTRVLVDVNDSVSEGQVLAEIDPEQLSARVRETSAQLETASANERSARATLAEAQTKAERVKALHDEGIASGDELATAGAALDRARANVGVAVAQISVANAGLASARSMLARAVIRAPISGIVLSRTVEPGQTVTAGFQTPILFTLARDLSELELEVEVDEADIGKVREGQTASFAVDAYPGRTFASRLLQLHNLPKEGATIVTYAAVLAVHNQDRSLRPGMTATAEIVTGQFSDVLLVDNAALRFQPPRPMAARRRGFLPIPGFGAGPMRPPERPAPDNAASAQEHIFLSDASGAPRRVAVDVLATDGTRSAIAPAVARPARGGAPSEGGGPEGAGASGARASDGRPSPDRFNDLARATDPPPAPPTPAPTLEAGAPVIIDVSLDGPP
jgi:HlyD family secretion protein